MERRGQQTITDPIALARGASSLVSSIVGAATRATTRKPASWTALNIPAEQQAPKPLGAPSGAAISVSVPGSDSRELLARLKKEEELRTAWQQLSQAKDTEIDKVKEELQRVRLDNERLHKELKRSRERSASVRSEDSDAKRARLNYISYLDVLENHWQPPPPSRPGGRRPRFEAKAVPAVPAAKREEAFDSSAQAPVQPVASTPTAASTPPIAGGAMTPPAAAAPFRSLTSQAAADPPINFAAKGFGASASTSTAPLVATSAPAPAPTSAPAPAPATETAPAASKSAAQLAFTFGTGMGGPGPTPAPSSSALPSKGFGFGSLMKTQTEGEGAEKKEKEAFKEKEKEPTKPTGFAAEHKPVAEPAKFTFPSSFGMGNLGKEEKEKEKEKEEAKPTGTEAASAPPAFTFGGGSLFTPAAEKKSDPAPEKAKEDKEPDAKKDTSMVGMFTFGGASSASAPAPAPAPAPAKSTAPTGGGFGLKPLPQFANQCQGSSEVTPDFDDGFADNAGSMSDDDAKEAEKTGEKAAGEATKLTPFGGSGFGGMGFASALQSSGSGSSASTTPFGLGGGGAFNFPAKKADGDAEEKKDDTPANPFASIPPFGGFGAPAEDGGAKKRDAAATSIPPEVVSTPEPKKRQRTDDGDAKAPTPGGFSFGTGFGGASSLSPAPASSSASSAAPAVPTFTFGASSAGDVATGVGASSGSSASAAPAIAGFGGFGAAPSGSSSSSSSGASSAFGGFGGFGAPSSSASSTAFGGFGGTTASGAASSSAFTFGTPAASTPAAAPGASQQPSPFTFGSAAASGPAPAPAFSFGSTPPPTAAGSGGGFAFTPSTLDAGPQFQAADATPFAGALTVTGGGPPTASASFAPGQPGRKHLKASKKFRTQPK